MYIRSFEDGMWLLEWWKVICALTKVSPSLSFVFTEQLRIPTECSLLEWKEMVSRNLFFLFMCLHQAWRWNLAIWMAEHDCGPVYASLFFLFFFSITCFHFSSLLEDRLLFAYMMRKCQMTRENIWFVVLLGMYKALRTERVCLL